MVFDRRIVGKLGAVPEGMLLVARVNDDLFGFGVFIVTKAGDVGFILFLFILRLILVLVFVLVLISILLPSLATCF